MDSIFQAWLEILMCQQSTFRLSIRQKKKIQAWVCLSVCSPVQSVVIASCSFFLYLHSFLLGTPGWPEQLERWTVVSKVVGVTALLAEW